MKYWTYVEASFLWGWSSLHSLSLFFFPQPSTLQHPCSNKRTPHLASHVRERVVGVTLYIPTASCPFFHPTGHTSLLSHSLSGRGWKQKENLTELQVDLSNYKHINIYARELVNKNISTTIRELWHVSRICPVTNVTASQAHSCESCCSHEQLQVVNILRPWPEKLETSLTEL